MTGKRDLQWRRMKQDRKRKEAELAKVDAPGDLRDCKSSVY